MNLIETERLIDLKLTADRIGERIAALEGTMNKIVEVINTQFMPVLSSHEEKLNKVDQHCQTTEAFWKDITNRLETQEVETKKLRDLIEVRYADLNTRLVALTGILSKEQRISYGILCDEEE